MNDIEVSSIDLVEGGNVFKQGHYLTLGYVPRDEKGETVDLSGKTLNVSLWGRKGVVFEAAATYSGGVIRFTLDKMVPAGDYTVEFTVTSSTDSKYRKKFPTNQHSGRIAIKQSADDLGVVGIQVYTVAQLKAEQKAIQTQYESTVDAKVQASDAKSTTALTKSTTAEATANDVKSQFEQVVISGDSSVEAAAARVAPDQTFVSLKARLDAKEQATAAQLEETAKDVGEVAIKTYATSTKLARKPIVTFRFDDGYTTDYTIVKPIAEAYNFPVTIAYISGEDNGMAKSPLTIAQALELQAMGWEFSGHTVSTNDLNVLSDAELERQLKKSKDMLEAWGLKVDTVIYPRGLSNPKVRKVVKKYYRAGMGTQSGINTVPIRQYNTYGYHMPDYTLDFLKGRVDAAIANNGWLVLYGHSSGDTFLPDEQEKFKQLIEYVQSKNVSIMTATKALDHFENALEIENDGTGDTFKIGADGIPYSKKIDEQNHIYTQASFYQGETLVKIDNATPITFFQKLKVTSTSFGTGHQSGIAIGTSSNMGGTLLTYRLNGDDVLNYQMFIPYNNAGSAVRYWTTSGWGVWRQAVLKTEMSSSHRYSALANAFLSTAVYADFESGTTVWDINSSGSAGYPATTGTVTMHKSSQGSQWSHQIFEQYQSANRYKRWMTSSTVWSDWVKVGQAIV